MDLILFQQNIELINVFLESRLDVQAKQLFLQQVLQDGCARVICLHVQIYRNSFEQQIQERALLNILTVFRAFPNDVANDIIAELLQLCINIPKDINCRCMLAGLVMFRAQVHNDLNQLDLVFELLNVNPTLTVDKNLVEGLLKDANAVRSQLADQVIRYFPKIT